MIKSDDTRSSTSFHKFLDKEIWHNTTAFSVFEGDQGFMERINSEARKQIYQNNMLFK